MDVIGGRAGGGESGRDLPRDVAALPIPATIKRPAPQASFHGMDGGDGFGEILDR
jgi:hypothetical protein